MNVTHRNVTFSKKNAYKFMEHSSNKCFLSLCGIFITCISSAFGEHHPIHNEEAPDKDIILKQMFLAPKWMFSRLIQKSLKQS